MFKANGNWFATYSFDRLTDGSPLGMMDELFDDEDYSSKDGGGVMIGGKGGQNGLCKRVEKSGSGVCMVFADEATLKSSFAVALN